MSKIKSKIITGYQGTISENINEWLESNPDIYIIDTCGFGPLSNDYMFAVTIFYGIRTKSNTPPTRENPNEDPKCPKCHRTMVVRSSNKTGELFWGCPKYPDCVSSLPFTEEDFERIYPTNQPDVPAGLEKPEDDDIPF